MRATRTLRRCCPRTRASPRGKSKKSRWGAKPPRPPKRGKGVKHQGVRSVLAGRNPMLSNRSSGPSLSRKAERRYCGCRPRNRRGPPARAVTILLRKPGRAVRRCTLIGVVPAILHPLPNIAVHVAQTPPVRRVQLLDTNRALPIDPFRTRAVSGRCHCSLPDRSRSSRQTRTASSSRPAPRTPIPPRRQAIGIAVHLPVQPGDVLLRVVPRDVDHRPGATAPASVRWIAIALATAVVDTRLPLIERDFRCRQGETRNGDIALGTFVTGATHLVFWRAHRECPCRKHHHLRAAITISELRKSGPSQVSSFWRINSLNWCFSTTGASTGVSTAQGPPENHSLAV